MRDGSLSGKVRTLRCLSAGYLNLDVVGVVLDGSFGVFEVDSELTTPGQRGGGARELGPTKAAPRNSHWRELTSPFHLDLEVLFSPEPKMRSHSSSSAHA